MRDPLDTVMAVVIGVVGACFLATKLACFLAAKLGCRFRLPFGLARPRRGCGVVKWLAIEDMTGMLKVMSLKANSTPFGANWG